jgi:tyrosinase
MQARYKSAADSFRIPYWDWARSDGSVPDFVMQQSVWITRTNGIQDYIYNPLYSYKFHSVIPGDFEGKVRHKRGTHPELTDCSGAT